MDPHRDIDIAFGTRMAEYRRKRGMSQAELSKRLAADGAGVRLDVSAISRLENGTRVPTLATALMIASTLNMTVDDLMPKPECDRALDLDAAIRDDLADGMLRVVEGAAKAIKLRRILLENPDVAYLFGTESRPGVQRPDIFRVHDLSFDDPLLEPSRYLEWLAETFPSADGFGTFIDGGEDATDEEILALIQGTARAFLASNARALRE